MGAVSYKFKVDNTSASTIHDLTSTTINPDAAMDSTPRQGGFTLRNKCNFANVPAANAKTFTIASASKSSASQTANTFRWLKVPRRTLVKGIRVMAIESASVPAHTVSATDSTSAGMGAAQLGFSGEVYKKSSSGTAGTLTMVTGVPPVVASLASTHAGGALGALALNPLKTTKCSLEHAFKSVDGSIASVSTGRVTHWEGNFSKSSIAYSPEGVYFPYGGYVTMAMGPYDVAVGNVSSANMASKSGVVSGTWEVQADCFYVPE